jgi:hypothetical protein
VLYCLVYPRAPFSKPSPPYPGFPCPALQLFASAGPTSNVESQTSKSDELTPIESKSCAKPPGGGRPLPANIAACALPSHNRPCFQQLPHCLFHNSFPLIFIQTARWVGGVQGEHQPKPRTSGPGLHPTGLVHTGLSGRLTLGRGFSSLLCQFAEPSRRGEAQWPISQARQ